MTQPQIKQNGSNVQPKGNWLRRNYLALLIFLAALAITIVLFAFQGEVKRFQGLGYAGAFIIGVICNATIVLPMPGILVIVPIGIALNPWLVGLVAGAGATLGEMTAYLAGYSGRSIWRDNKTYLRAADWLRKWGIWIIFLVSVTPLPIDVMGLAAGNLRFPWWKYFLGCLPGKLIKYVILIFAGVWGYGIYRDGGPLLYGIEMVGIAIAAIIVLLALAFLLENWSWSRQRRG
jgi:membrane protein YqaA with SNARE-associated domain